MITRREFIAGVAVIPLVAVIPKPSPTHEYDLLDTLEYRHGWMTKSVPDPDMLRKGIKLLRENGSLGPFLVPCSLESYLGECKRLGLEPDQAWIDHCWGDGYTGIVLVEIG